MLKCFGKIGGAEWLTVTMAVIAGREVQKYKDFKYSKKETNEESLGSD